MNNNTMQLKILLSSFTIYISILFLINNANASFADHLFDNSSCNGRYWGGFVNNNCSCNFLYSLALRANQTGEIFLNSGEADFSVCGGCSDFSTLDVNNKFGNRIELLRSKCGSCDSCLRSWEEIKEAESEICRFAVLVTLVSTANEKRASRIFDCLGNQQIVDSELAKNTPRKKIRPGLCVLIGGIVGFFAVVIFSILILSRRRRETPIAPVDKDDWKPALSVLLKDSALMKIPIEEILSATNNLLESNFIGEGTSGKVYKGVLSNNQCVAIKKITNDANADSFLREIGSLVHVRHSNLVTLMGYCENGSECFLIYELCPNGNLSEWLYGKDDKILSWIRRLEVAIGSAKGLRFLHTFPRGCIVHRDIKPTNILIGTNFEAKLSDFGLSKVMNLGETSVSSEVRGTFGYVDPEYHRSNPHTSAKTDIYSYGIVLLQILSGRKVIDMNMKKPKTLDKIAKSVTKNRKIVEFADPNLHGEYSIEAFRLVFELAISCTGDKQKRPSINEVVVKLEDALGISKRMEPSTPDWSKVP
ncbi:hypothetical protein ACP275_08G013600 [Erythranthe tilingii]